MAGKIIWDTRKNCSEYPAEIKKIYFGKYLKLRKEYTKWNAQTNHKDTKKKKRAKEIVKVIANLRKQYNC